MDALRSLQTWCTDLVHRLGAEPGTCSILGVGWCCNLDRKRRADVRVSSTRQHRGIASRNKCGRNTRALTPPLGFCPFFGVIPPSFGNGAEITRLRRRTAEHVPIGDPVRGLVPVRNPIPAGSDHPVQGATGSGEGLARRRSDDGLNQSVDRRVGYPGEIVGSLERCRLGGEERSQ